MSFFWKTNKIAVAFFSFFVFFVFLFLVWAVFLLCMPLIISVCLAFAEQVEDEQRVLRPSGGGAHGWGEGDHQRRAGSRRHDGEHGAGAHRVRRKNSSSPLPPRHHQVKSSFFFFSAGVKLVPTLCPSVRPPSGASPSAWITSRRRRAGTDAPSASCAGPPSDPRGSRPSSASSAIK